MAYSEYDEDGHREKNGTWVTDGGLNGTTTRLGVRMYSRSRLGDNSIQPFVEANWWHGTAQSTLRFGDVLVTDGTPSDTYELKAGLQGEVAKHWQLWGHVGERWGANDYRRYEGMLGVKYQF